MRQLLLLITLTFALVACGNDDVGDTNSTSHVSDISSASSISNVNNTSHENKPQPLTQVELQKLDERLEANGLKKGDAVFVRIFKKEGVFELWMKPQGQKEYILFRSYPICYFSGDLGSKKMRGDRQAPEGFYAVGQRHLHPGTNYHLAFNLGYPNAYDQAMGYTGDFIMVHGGCASAGCYAITDVQVEEVYTLVEAALNNGQPFFRVHVFPFHLTPQNLSLYENNEWLDFWKMLKPGYDAFENTHIPPNIEVVNKRYQVSIDSP